LVLRFSEIRVDAGCFTNGSIGWGMISSNCVGVLLVATTKFEKIEGSPTLPLALRLRWCLQWVKEEDLVNLRSVCDSELSYQDS